MTGKTFKKLITMDCVQLGEWLIKASQMNDKILLIMFNHENGDYTMQWLNNVQEVNLMIEYIIEKGGIND